MSQVLPDTFHVTQSPLARPSVIVDASLLATLALAPTLPETGTRPDPLAVLSADPAGTWSHRRAEILAHRDSVESLRRTRAYRRGFVDGTAAIKSARDGFGRAA